MLSNCWCARYLEAVLEHTVTPKCSDDILHWLSLPEKDRKVVLSCCPNTEMPAGKNGSLRLKQDCWKHVKMLPAGCTPFSHQEQRRQCHLLSTQPLTALGATVHGGIRSLFVHCRHCLVVFALVMWMTDVQGETPAPLCGFK